MRSVRIATAVILVLAGVALADDKRLAVPDADAVAKADAIVKEVHASEYRNAATGAQRAFAAKLVAEARQTNDDAAARYVLLREAIDVGAKAGSVAAVVEAVELLAATYVVKPLEERALALGKIKVAAISGEAVALVDAFSALADSAVAEDSYAIAVSAALQALDNAQEQKDRLQALRARADEVTALKKSWDDLAPFMKRLESDPADAEANSAVGSFLCLDKRDWNKGLLHLSKGVDAKVREAATADLECSGEPAAAIVTGDAWWDQAPAEKVERRAAALRRRAVEWYQRAVASTSGLTRARLEKRIEQEIKAKPDRIRCDFARGSVDLRDWVIQGSWKVVNKELVGTEDGATVVATLKRHFSSIKSVTFRARIVAPSRENLRLQVGPLNAIFNWERAAENHFRWGEERTEVKGYALVPGREHRIEVRQQGKNVVVLVDGKTLYEHAGSLQGTVSFYPAAKSVVALRELVVEGQVDPSREVKGPSDRIY